MISTFVPNFRHGIELRFPHQSLLRGRKVFEVGNYLLKDRKNKNKGSSYLLFYIFVFHILYFLVLLCDSYNPKVLQGFVVLVVLHG